MRHAEFDWGSQAGSPFLFVRRGLSFLCFGLQEPEKTSPFRKKGGFQKRAIHLRVNAAGGYPQLGAAQDSNPLISSRTRLAAALPGDSIGDPG